MLKERVRAEEVPGDQGALGEHGVEGWVAQGLFAGDAAVEVALKHPLEQVHGWLGYPLVSP